MHVQIVLMIKHMRIQESVIAKTIEQERERNRKKKSGLSNAVSSLSIIILHSLSVYQREHIFADDEEELLFSYVRELP